MSIQNEKHDLLGSVGKDINNTIDSVVGWLQKAWDRVTDKDSNGRG